MNTHHYYVTHENKDGDALDWIVEAHTAVEALCLWKGMVRTCFEFDPDEKVRVFRIAPLTGQPRTLAWHATDGVQQVL